ncbi:LIM and calponin homology domains-containing protein 1 isoform X3 [Esox lucius]|uniref:LIM and calponin homology domains-containing protein 1 isoform X3 n=1 Tax=Esox lucius TaxID=8010 RepID=UPI0014774403|nr:LIM and calponin homology domains-containing protein 1 isoform X3 [Esox lucius]
MRFFVCCLRERGRSFLMRAVTGRGFCDKDFRGGLENGILLCELLSSIKPGLVKKINRLPTPIAGLDNLSVFLRGCEELGLKGSQLFDPGDLQVASTRPNAKFADCSRKLKNVLVTIYWLGRAANSCTSYNGPTLDLKEFEGLLSQMRKEADDTESPQRSIRDSGYVDCWDSERSDSLSPPRHGREDSFDSLDSFGSRSRQTPSPDVPVARGIGSDGRGSDSESDAGPHGGRKLPDIRKDDMLARRTSVSEPRVLVPFNQYLPNKSNASGYVPTPLRRKRGDREGREEASGGGGGSRKSWSTATSPIGGEKPFSPTVQVPTLEVPRVIAPIVPRPPEPQSQPLPQPQNRSEERRNGKEYTEDRKEEGGMISACPWRQERNGREEEFECRLYAPPLRSQSPSLTHGETDLNLKVTAQQSSPARSCSEELYRPSSLTTSSMTTSIVVTSPLSPSPGTSRKLPPLPVVYCGEAGPKKKGMTLSLRTDTGRKDNSGTASPSQFLPVPVAVATTTLTVACQGRTERSEVEDRKCNKPPVARRPSWLADNHPPTFSHRAASVSDGSESVSMIDMRCEEDAILPAHSQARHELMHNQYNMLKEEEDHWQDDLARWKSRRRSVSQDLIKKEEERKMMEKLMTGDGGATSQRRKSIKTYREIVEEKERRENELREAYRSARTPEEAAAVLHRYAQRFTISEAVLERLQLPKLLDRSVSDDPSAATRLPLTPTSCPPTPASPEDDPNGPMKYLRQQSLPAPKFTATVEARVLGFPQGQSHRPQIRSRTPEPNPTARGVSTKSVPLLTPKPYIQPKGMQTQAPARPGKVDGLLRVNGETGNDEVTTPESEGRTSPLRFYPCPDTPTASFDPFDTPPRAATPQPAQSPSPRASQSPAIPVDAEVGSSTSTMVPPSSVSGEGVAQESKTWESAPPSRPTSLPVELQSAGGMVDAGGMSAAGTLEEEEPNTAEAAAKPSPATVSQQDSKGQTEVCMNAKEARPDTPPLVQSEPTKQQAALMNAQVRQPSLASSQRPEEVAALADPGPVGNTLRCEAPTTELTDIASYPLEPGNPRLGRRREFFTPSEGAEKELGKVAVTQVSSPIVTQAKRGDRWSWDPDEERKRQKRWQQEQERMLQEKYRREQEKLKQEWEKAQREVEEEERRYHEEERRILEETVTPLTPHSSALPSPIRGEAPLSMDPQDTIVRSLADWERKQELLERQGGSSESVEWKQRDNDRSSDISTASRDDSMKTAVSSISQNSSRSDKLTPSIQNGQRVSPNTVLPNKKPQPEMLLDCTRPSQQTASRDRRCGSIETMAASPSKSPTTSPSDMPPSPNRSVSGKKLCSSCGNPLGKGAAMIIETLSLYFHIQCFKCGVCKGQLGDTSTGTDVRIRNGLLNCHQCYIRSRSAGQPTTL